MKTKSKQLLFAVSGTILLGGGVWMSHLRSQDGSNSDMLLANIEAMADGEVEAGWVSTKITTDSYGQYSDAGGGLLCRPHIIETTCWGTGTEWCTHTSSLSQDCYTPNH